MKIKTTLIVSDKPSRLTKKLTLKNGEIVTEAGGYMIEGTYTVREFDGLGDFAEMLPSLRTNEALVYGVPKESTVGKIVTKAMLENMPEAKRSAFITRSNDCFCWSDEAGIFMIDIDPPAHGEPMTKEAAISMIRDVAPELKNVQMLWYPSSSSYIYSDDGNELRGLCGQRIYVPVTNASTIPALADALWKRAWAAGHGSILISKAGQVLKRSFFDKSVYQPSRLDFAAGAKTGNGIVQKRGLPEFV